MKIEFLCNECVVRDVGRVEPGMIRDVSQNIAVRLIAQGTAKAHGDRTEESLRERKRSKAKEVSGNE